MPKSKQKHLNLKCTSQIKIPKLNNLKIKAGDKDDQKYKINGREQKLQAKATPTTLGSG